MHSVPHSSAVKNILLCDYRNISLKPECVDVNQLESLVQKVQGCIIFSKQELRNIKKKSQVSVVFHDEIVHVVQCN